MYQCDRRTDRHCMKAKAVLELFTNLSQKRCMVWAAILLRDDIVCVS